MILSLWRDLKASLPGVVNGICCYILASKRTKKKKTPLLGLVILKNLQLCYSTIINLWWYCSNILNINTIFYCLSLLSLFLFLIFLLSLYFSQQPSQRSLLSLFDSLGRSHSLVLGLVPLNHIVWCYVWYYVWHYVWLNVVINKVVLLLSKIMVTWIFGHYHLVHEMHSMWFSHRRYKS